MKNILLVIVLLSGFVLANATLNRHIQGCIDGKMLDCWAAGYHYDSSSVKQDYLIAAEYYRKSCNGGYYNACTNLGLMYTFGKGLKQNDPKANDLFMKACNKNDGFGCVLLGVNYERGGGVKQDLYKAKELYRKSCDLLDEIGCLKYEMITSKLKPSSQNEDNLSK